jgi:hypothetical protein
MDDRESPVSRFTSGRRKNGIGNFSHHLVPEKQGFLSRTLTLARTGNRV